MCWKIGEINAILVLLGRPVTNLWGKEGGESHLGLLLGLKMHWSKGKINKSPMVYRTKIFEIMAIPSEAFGKTQNLELVYVY